MKKRILVVGDVMIDRYVNVKTSRKAAEADIPVWDELSTRHVLGGAGNVAANVKSLLPDAEVCILGIYSHRAFDELNARGIRSVNIEDCSEMVKTRFVEEDKIIFRVDNFKKFELKDMVRLSQLETRYLDTRFDVVIFSDYDKGTLTETLVSNLMSTGIKTIVDSKRSDLSIFKGCDILKINRGEYDSLRTDQVTYPEKIFPHVIVTHGEQPTMYRDRNEKGVIRSCFVGVRSVLTEVDVTGCGDTHTAALAVAISNGLEMIPAIQYANDAASVVVSKMGTAVVKPEEIETRLCDKS